MYASSAWHRTPMYPSNAWGCVEVPKPRGNQRCSHSDSYSIWGNAKFASPMYRHTYPKAAILLHTCTYKYYSCEGQPRTYFWTAENRLATLDYSTVYPTQHCLSKIQAWQESRSCLTQQHLMPYLSRFSLKWWMNLLLSLYMITSNAHHRGRPSYESCPPFAWHSNHLLLNQHARTNA